MISDIRPQNDRSRDGSGHLVVKDLHAFYGESHVLHGVSFVVRKGELVTLLGRNGAGKSTTLKSIIGMMRRKRGTIQFRGHRIDEFLPYRIGRLGLAYCPEDRGIFASLTVRENLLLPPVLATGGMTSQELYELFPNLLERAESYGTRLSGGEQQMLAIARILRTGADTLLLDEPTEGLAPVVVQQLGSIIASLKARGMTIILVEQNLHFARSLSDYFYVVEGGRVVDEVDADGMRDQGERIEKRLAV